MTQIIVVDDDRDNSRLIRMLLEMDGYGVQLCPNLTQAQAAASAETSAFIIDYYLAQGEIGVDLVTMIRSDQTNARLDTPIIVTSGDERRREVALEAGANIFLLKPYGPSVLSAEISQLTGGDKTSG